MEGYWNIKQLSQYLNVKPSTIYSWAAEGKIPLVRIHHLIRFRKEEIESWLRSLKAQDPKLPAFSGKANNSHIRTLDDLIAHAKKQVYNPARGKPDQAKAGKEVDDDL